MLRPISFYDGITKPDNISSASIPTSKLSKKNLQMLGGNDGWNNQSHKASKATSGRYQMKVIEQYFDMKSRDKKSQAMSQSRLKKKLNSAKVIDEMVQSCDDVDLQNSIELQHGEENSAY